MNLWIGAERPPAWLASGLTAGCFRLQPSHETESTVKRGGLVQKDVEVENDAQSSALGSCLGAGQGGLGHGGGVVQASVDRL